MRRRVLLDRRHLIPREARRIEAYARNGRIRKGYRWLTGCGASRGDALARLARVWGLSLDLVAALVDRRKVGDDDVPAEAPERG